MNTDPRDPDRILARLQREEQERTRGHLKIFFGANAGVGKTYAMLEQARARTVEGWDVVAGWVETHGRKETQALLEGLEQLPPRRSEYRGSSFSEFDLDAALRRRPRLLLLDELAHSNVPGSRHAKRWEDAEELLQAGIDVYTAVNVQHFESVNDVVAQITGITVRETVPDRILDRADEIEMIDLTPDDLLQRLREGKVYLGNQAERALEGFFSKGNLIALRELALRCVAERVDAQMRTYKTEEGIERIWPAAESILVCVSPNPAAPSVVRAACRMAEGLRTRWIVAYVETPGRLHPTEADREQIKRTLELAEQLGAETVILNGASVSEELLAFARTRNVTQIVVGKPARPWWRYRLLGSVVDNLIRGSEEIAVHVIRGTREESSAPPRALRPTSPARSYAWGAIAALLATGIAWLLMRLHLSPSTLIMVYLLGVVLTSSRFGRGPAILGSILSVAAFDFFFVPPYHTFRVRDTEYLITLAVMLVVALVISTLVLRIRRQAEFARLRERRTNVLYRMTATLSRAASIKEAVNAAEQYVAEVLDGEVWVLLPDENGHLAPGPGVTSLFPLGPKEVGVAQWVFDHGTPAGHGTSTLPGAQALYIPLTGSRGSVGVVGLFLAGTDRSLDPDHFHLLETLAGQIALAIERAHLEEEAQAARLRAEAERMRNALLSSVLHDLRTPLTSITGAASSLLEEEGRFDPETRRELLLSISDEADRMNRLVQNLLSMTRLESGALRPNKQWHPIEEVVGAALTRLEKQLTGRPIEMRLPEDLSLVPLDDVLIEQVLFNLLDNALKHTPAGSPIGISASLVDGGIEVSIADRGPGLPAGDEERVFEKFHRSGGRPGQGGVGLGLTICRGIVESHGGTIRAENRPGGGAVFSFILPIEGQPSEWTEEAMDEMETAPEARPQVQTDGRSHVGLRSQPETPPEEESRP